VKLDGCDNTLRMLTTTRRDLFPEVSATPLFAGIDEAQVAEDSLRKRFRSTTGTDVCHSS